MSFVIIIPARYESSRFAGKPLKPILGKPMVEWTWLQALKSGAHRVIIATESTKVEEVCKGFGANVVLTSEQHNSGTERIAEVIKKCNLSADTIVVNVQGDEPMLPHKLVQQVANALKQNPEIPVATLCEPINCIKTIFDPNAVKVTRNLDNIAINFSRAPIPWSRETFNCGDDSLPDNFQYYRHIGLYAYRAKLILEYINWQECDLEKIEKLEQLRILWHGKKILVLDAIADAGIGVDTEQDLQQVEKLLQESL